MRGRSADAHRRVPGVIKRGEPSMTRQPLSGIVVPIPTLFDDRGRVDNEANARHVDWLITRGVHGIFALGTTGEFTSLSSDERRAFAALAVRAARGRVPV